MILNIYILEKTFVKFYFFFKYKKPNYYFLLKNNNKILVYLVSKYLSCKKIKSLKFITCISFYI